MNAIVSPNHTTQIHEILLSIGIPPNLLGYNYIIYAADLILSEPKYLKSVTTRLYVDVAEKYHSTPARVERAIRHALTVAWTYGNTEYIDYMFMYCIRPDKGTPTNSLFLARLYHYITNMEAE